MSPFPGGQGIPEAEYWDSGCRKVLMTALGTRPVFPPSSGETGAPGSSPRLRGRSEVGMLSVPASPDLLSRFPPGQGLE